MTPVETKFLIWACLALLSIIAFIGAIFINSFLKMAKDINEIKTEIKVAGTKHDSLEKRVEHLELKAA
jgi:hypothetical protein